MDVALRRRLEARFGEQLTAPIRQRHDQTEIRIGPGEVPSVCRTLHDDADFRFVVLADLAGVDTGTSMQVVYHLWSDTSPDWLRVIADGLSRDDPRVPSVTFLWPGAEWMEREAYDMFGITFEGNRDLRRIYMSPDYRSFPQRKDFLLPDDAADSPAAGVNPLERPETWDLTTFTRELTSSAATYPPNDTAVDVPAEAYPTAQEAADKSRPA